MRATVINEAQMRTAKKQKTGLDLSRVQNDQ